jgi:hypothetical protein
MIKNKKTLTAILLMLVYALLLFQEIAVNQVLCYKKDGAVNLELAVLSFKCNCIEIHNHPLTPHHIPNPDQCSQLDCQLDNCTDQPINTCWLVRDLNSRPSGSRFYKQNNPNDQINCQSFETLNRFSTAGFLIKLTKFLSKLSPQEGNTILRC